jgi:putative transposase
MNHYNSLSHSKWECKYHIVFIPKYRRKALYGAIKRHLGIIFHELARQKECVIEEGHIMPDHVHMLISIPPKRSVSEIVGFIKGKSAIQIARQFMNREKNYTGCHFWARGYFVSTVGRNEEVVKKYIQEQDKRDRAADQLPLNLPR